MDPPEEDSCGAEGESKRDERVTKDSQRRAKREPNYSQRRAEGKPKERRRTNEGESKVMQRPRDVIRKVQISSCVSLQHWVYQLWPYYCMEVSYFSSQDITSPRMSSNRLAKRRRQLRLQHSFHRGGKTNRRYPGGRGNGGAASRRPRRAGICVHSSRAAACRLAPPIPSPDAALPYPRRRRAASTPTHRCAAGRQTDTGETNGACMACIQRDLSRWLTVSTNMKKRSE